MLTIGLFARLCGTTIKTLRFYDRMGVLRPLHVDVETAYRYYDASQHESFAVVQRLRTLGFSVADIRRIVAPRSNAVLHDALAAQRRRLEELVSATRSQLDHLDGWVSELEGRGRGVLPLVRLAVDPPGHFATLRFCVDDLEQCGEVTTAALGGGAHLRCPLAITWHSCPESGPAECEVVVPGPVVSRVGRFGHVERHGGHVATLVHRGPIGDAGPYKALRAWIDSRRLVIRGPKRELYWRGSPASSLPSDITEIQFPVSLPTDVTTPLQRRQ